MDLTTLNQRILGLALGLCVACSVLLPDVAPADDAPPEYVGVYAQPQVWKGTVVMAGDVLIPAGGHLTIKAGTEVRVMPAEGTQIDPEYLSSQTELLVRGGLDIQGTEDAPVRFVLVERPGLEEYAWAGITLDHAANSRILHAEIMRADTGVRCVNCSPLLEGNLISGCRYGIVAQLQSHPKILSNLLRDGEGGIFCWRGSDPYLKYNRIVAHDEEGVFVDMTSRPILDRNTISGNAIGLALYPTELPYDATEISGNSEDIRWLGKQGLNRRGL